ncbi:MAG: ribosome maturation factor RimP [Firmicutes bacterium]|nr:ribosome maturation factor RimP [Bacillota bacterium]MCL1954202.1 ribosome maturation factor RimP [Bacillota bacterium]
MNIQSVYNAINPTIQDLGYEIVDIEYKLKDDYNLTIFCDSISGNGFGLDDCEKINNAVDEILDILNPTQDKPYILNISSTGLDRPFKTPRDWQRNIGREIDINLYKSINKKSNLQGELLSYNDDSIVLKNKKGEIIVKLQDIKLATQLIKF